MDATNLTPKRRCSGAMSLSCDQADVRLVHVSINVERPMCASCRAVARLMGMVR